MFNRVFVLLFFAKKCYKGILYVYSMKKILSFFLITAEGVAITFAGWSLSIDTTPRSNTSQLTDLIQSASKIVSMLVPTMIALGVLAFFWYLVQFIWKGADDPKKHADGMKGMGYSILAIFVMVSIWGIIAFIGTTVGIGQGGGMEPLSLPGMR